MNISSYMPTRWTAGCVSILVTLLVVQTAAALPQQSNEVAAPQAQQGTDNGAGKPGTTLPQAPSSTNPVSQNGDNQKQTDQQQNGPKSAVGTAAAPYEKPSGIAASRPAGAAIAPAKQKRTRSILIKTSILIGGAIAIATVAALSKSSPSQPH